MSTTILVTGCSSGIGRHCAIRLRRDGWRVFATARTPDDIAQLERLGLEAVHLDYADGQSIRDAFAEVMSRTGGRLDALFNNGAYGQAGAVEDISTQTLREQFEANFFGWHELTQLAVPVMRKQGGGRIVHCSSILGIVPYRWRGAYNASKHALEALALTQRMELAGSGVHVSLIEPGPIVSDFSKNGLRHFRQKVDIDGSVHAQAYRGQLARLDAPGGVNLFRRKPQAVYKRLKQALTARRPRAQYAVTIPTHVMFMMRRALPYAMLERFLEFWD